MIGRSGNRLLPGRFLSVTYVASVLATGFAMSVRALLLPALAFALAASPAPPPDLTGRFAVDPATGQFAGNVCISGAASSGAKGFALYRGFNIREVRDVATGVSLLFDRAETPAANDGMRYDLAKAVGPQGFCVDYVAAFPVYRVDQGERAPYDWKGLIAFDGRTVRATDQTRFYPAPIDPRSGAELGSMSYRVRVECRRCRNIYMNGAAPAAGPLAEFASALPRPLLLYGGDFPVATVGGAHFVGVPLVPAQGTALSADLKAIGRVHQDYLHVPYGDTVSFLSFASIGSNRKIGRNTWEFVTWPTIAMDGRVGFDTLLSPTTGHLLPSAQRYLAHEVAHYYFGGLYQGRGPLRWFLVESTAEFLSLKFVRQVQGEEAFRTIWKGHVADAEKLVDTVPLDRLTNPEQIGDQYRYRLGPLLLFELERYVGPDTVRRTLAGLITNPPPGELDYKGFAARLAEAGAKPGQLAAFARDCLVPHVDDKCLVYPAA